MELILMLDELSQSQLQAAIETTFPEADLQLGGRARGAHEPGGPYPVLDVVEEDIGEMILPYSAGKTGLEKVGFFAMARPLDLIWLKTADANRFLRDGGVPAYWLLIDDAGKVEEIDRDRAISLSRSDLADQLALATIDSHE